MQIKRIYYDIIKEGFYSGRPSVFLEFREKEGESMSVEDAAKRVNSFPCKTLSITESAFRFPRELRGVIGVFRNSHFLRVLVGGEYYVPEDVYGQVHCWSVNVRCPSSGLMDANKYSITRLGKSDEVRFYINGGDDLDFAAFVAHKHDLQTKTNVMLIPTESLLSRTVDFARDYLSGSYVSVPLGLDKGTKFNVEPEKELKKESEAIAETTNLAEPEKHTLETFLDKTKTEEVHVVGKDSLETDLAEVKEAPVVKRKRGRPRKVIK